jgi:hypothetical protein
MEQNEGAMMRVVKKRYRKKLLKDVFTLGSIVLFLLVVLSPAVVQSQNQRGNPSTAAMIQELLNSVQSQARGVSESSRVTWSSDGFVRYMGTAPGQQSISGLNMG